jgi:hypothetical protein
MSNNEDNMFSLDTILKEIDNKELPQKSKSAEKKIGNKKVGVNMNNYAEIPKEEWNLIPMDTYIRYKENDVIQQGGRIIKIVPNLTITIRYFIRRGNFGTKVIQLNNVSNIYKFVKLEKDDKSNKKNKINNTADGGNPVTDPATPISQLGDKILFTNNESLKEEIDILKKEVDNLKAHITRIDDNTVSLIKMIKKIYKTST